MSTPDIARQNLARWRELAGRDYFACDPHFQSLLAFHGREHLAPELHAFGTTAAELDAKVSLTNRDENLPRLRRWSDHGERIEEVVFHPAYHDIGRAYYNTGVMAKYAQAGREFETLALTYIAGQNGESGHTCPFACTSGLIKILQGAPAGYPADWMPRLLDRDYDTHMHGAQFLTEVQGGSDVGANAVVAEPAEGGWSRITGEKWFCSVADAQLMLVTARTTDAKGTRGVGAFAVPRHLPDGRLNDFHLRRLKFKLGTKSMASGEIDFQGALGWPVGDFKDTVGVVLNTSRLFNAVVSTGLLQRAAREADSYARTREAWGQPILRFPAVARNIANLHTQACASRGLTFALAALADTRALGQSTETQEGAWRMLVNLNKYWTSFQCTAGIRDAIEMLGGNGAIEEFSVLPRLLRDSIVCEQWEGPHNILCQQVLRDSARLGLHEPMFAWLESLAGPHPLLDHARQRWDQLLALPQGLQMAHVRDVADELQTVAQLLPLLAEVQAGSSDERLPHVVQHWASTRAQGYDPLADAGLMERVAAIVG